MSAYSIIPRTLFVLHLTKCIFIFYGNVCVFALSSSVLPANLMKQRGKGSGLCSACSVLFAIGPCSIVFLKWRLNAIALSLITCIKLPLAIFCGIIINTPFQKYNAALPSRKKTTRKSAFFQNLCNAL